MLKKNSPLLNDLLFGQGLWGLIEVVTDRMLFFIFYKALYQRTFKYYGKNIRWGRGFRKFIIPKSVRLSCPEKISIGDNCQIDDFVFLQSDSGEKFESGITLGEKVRINSNSHILAGSKIEIGDEVLIAPFCLITSNNHRIDLDISIMNQGMKHSGEVFIGKGSWIGQDSKILGGAYIGENSVVGAGAIVLKGNYPSRSKVLGLASKIKS
ncbi:MAG: acyltransferase [Bacteriovorax sp.]|nr:acyltransferase [Bacteriovorax sp.]